MTRQSKKSEVIFNMYNLVIYALIFIKKDVTTTTQNISKNSKPELENLEDFVTVYKCLKSSKDLYLRG
jgi:hypothetical protein